MSIWNDIGPTAWGDDPLGNGFEADLAEARRRIADSHTAARRNTRVHGDAFAIMSAIVTGHRLVIACADLAYARAVVDAVVESSGGTVDAETAARYVTVTGRG